MKFVCIFIALFFWCSVSALYAQQDKIEVMLNKLSATTSDTNRVNLLNELAWQYIHFSLENTKKYAEEALTLSQKLDFQKGEILALSYLGDYYTRHAQYALAIDHLTKSLKVATQAKDSLGMADAYRLLGVTHGFSLHQYDIALQYQQKALAIYEQRGNKQRTLGLYGNMSWVFCMMEKQLPLAYTYTEKAISIAKEMKNDRLISWALNSMGLVFSKQDQLDSALFYLEESNAYAAKANDQAVTIYNINLIGDIYLRQSKSKEALATFRKNVTNIKQQKINLLLSDAYKGLADAHHALNQYDSAYWYYKEHITLRDSLLGWETSQKVMIIEAEYAEERKQARIDYLEKERIIVSSIAMFAFASLLFILWIIIRNNKHKKQANELLTTKNEEIAQQNEELAQSQEEITTQRDKVAVQNKELQELNETKNKLFAIIGHDLRSPINSLKGMLNLLTQRHISVDEFFMFSEKLKNGVEHVYFTLNNLLQWANSQMEGLKSNPQNVNIYNIGKENINLFTQISAHKKIQFVNQLQENLIVFADPDQLNLVFRNLISNAVKFSSEGGSITLGSKLVGNFCEITINDTGIGMGKENISKLFSGTTHFTTTGTIGEKGTGLGLLLCQEMIAQNGGKIWVESTLDQGTSFYFTLPFAKIIN